MSELVCEEIAHRAGFVVSIGNWIAPDGTLIVGEDYENHHWETLIRHLGYEPQTDNNLRFMNEKIQEGFIRLVFRSDVFFQVGCEEKEDIWNESSNTQVMMEILAKISDIEIHIFSKYFYIIGMAQDILNQSWDDLQIREEKRER